MSAGFTLRRFAMFQSKIRTLKPALLFLPLRRTWLVNDSHAAHLFRVIFAVEQIPFFASFQNFLFLRTDFFPDFGVHRFFFLQQVLQDLQGLLADRIPVLDEFNIVTSN